MWILWIHDLFLELPPKTHNRFFFLDSEIRIWIFPKKRTLYVDGRCYSHTQFPRSPLETPGTMDPPGYIGHQIRRKQKRLAFLDSRSCEALVKKACILRLSLPLKLKKKRACIFRLSLLRNLNKKKRLAFSDSRSYGSSIKKRLAFSDSRSYGNSIKKGLHFQTLAPTEAQEKKACILRVSLRDKVTAFRKWTENDYKLAHFLFLHIQGCIFSKYIHQFFVSSVSTWQYDFR